MQEGWLQVQFDQSMKQVSGQLRIREVQTNTASPLFWLLGAEAIWQSHGGPRLYFSESLHEELKEVKKYRKWFLHLWLLGRQQWYHWLLSGSALGWVGAFWDAGRRGGNCAAPPLCFVIPRGIFSFGVKQSGLIVPLRLQRSDMTSEGQGVQPGWNLSIVAARSWAPPAPSGTAHPVLAQLKSFGCSSLGRNRDSSCGTKQFSHNFYRKFYAFLYCLQNLYKTIILKEVKWIKLLWSWNGSCALELLFFFFFCLQGSHGNYCRFNEYLSLA